MKIRKKKVTINNFLAERFNECNAQGSKLDLTYHACLFEVKEYLELYYPELKKECNAKENKLDLISYHACLFEVQEYLEFYYPELKKELFKD